jgi:hypothetical protein
MDQGKLIKVGIENNNENRSIAWALDFPGCFAYGSSETEALIRIPQALIAFKSSRGIQIIHGCKIWGISTFVW